MFKDAPQAPEGTAGETIVGNSVKLEGDLISDENISINGKVSGKVATSKNLGIGETAEVKANIEAENIVIAGKVEGDVKAREKLEITETGKVTGNISAKTLAVSPGALFSGQCVMEGEGKTEEVEEEEAEE